MGRSPCCSKEGLNRGGWTAQEDKILTDYIKAHGEGRWRNLPKKAGLRRCGKSCRLRWLNYLRPDIKRGNISPDEEELIIRLHKLLGNRWSLIAGRLPGRTDNEIKNYWNTRLGKMHQANHEIAHKKTKMPPGTGSALPGQPKHNPQTPVVRTRAFKCSKQVFLSPQRPERPELPNSHQSSYQTRDHRRDMPAEPNPMDEKGLSSFDCSKENGLVIDSLLNFDVGELCLSDLLNFTDFSTSSTCSLEHQPETMLYDELEPIIDSTRVR